MNKLKERIPLLLSQARTRATDLTAAESSLRAAEQTLNSARYSDPAWHWMWYNAARDIAGAWHSITADPDKAESCLQHALVTREKDTRSWIEMASSLRVALGTRRHQQGWDIRTRKYLLRAEGSAADCRDWCDCANAWLSESDDRERALECLHAAETMASSFHDFVRCARAWKQHEECDRVRVKYWTAKASERAVTSWDWLVCADIIAESDEFRARRYLEEAEDRAGTYQGFVHCALAASQQLGAKGFSFVMRCLGRAEKVIRNREEVCRQVFVALWLQSRSEKALEPVVGVANREQLDAYCEHCWETFLGIRPRTEDWVALLKGLQWRKPYASNVDILLGAEASARSAGDWSQCADAWTLSKLPDARKNAAICRLRALRVGTR